MRIVFLTIGFFLMLCLAGAPLLRADAQTEPVAQAVPQSPPATANVYDMSSRLSPALTQLLYEAAIAMVVIGTLFVERPRLNRFISRLWG